MASLSKSRKFLDMFFFRNIPDSSEIWLARLASDGRLARGFDLKNWKEAGGMVMKMDSVSASRLQDFQLRFTVSV